MQTKSKSSAQVQAQECKLYTTDEVAEIFRVSTRTIQNWRDKGHLDYVQQNHVILYSQEDIDEFLRKNHSKNSFRKK